MAEVPALEPCDALDVACEDLGLEMKVQCQYNNTSNDG